MNFRHLLGCDTIVRKFFISTIQTLNLSLHCTYSQLSCSMEVNKEELLIHILQGASNTDGIYPMRQTALQVYVIHSPCEIISTAGKTGYDARWKRKQS